MFYILKVAYISSKSVLDFKLTLTASATLVKEAIELSHKNQATTSKHREGDSESRSLELRFSNNIVSPLLTGDPIKAIGGMPLEVSLVDSCTKETVKSGPGSSGRAEIQVLEAEIDKVTGEDVKSNSILVWQTEGNKSTRVGKLSLKLTQGTATLPMVSFARNEKWTKNSKLKLRAKFVENHNGIRVKEAKSGPFLLKDCRTATYRKHSIPSLEDDVWRLNNIDRNGCLAENMKHAEIKTVGDFLVHLFLQTECLKEIFVRSKHAHSWNITVNHARKCPAKLHYCSSFDQKTKVVFNVSGKVLGLSLDNRFLSSERLSESQKEMAKKLVISAFENWGDVNVIPVDENQLDATPRNFDNVFLDLHIDETCLFGNVVSDGQSLNPESLPKSLRRKYNEIYQGFESVCVSNRTELEASQRNRLCKRWKILFCVVTFKIRSLPEKSLYAHKKPRLA